MRYSRNKVLFLVQLPPPIHGAALVNKSIQQSRLMNNAFKTYYVDISPAKDLADIGRFKLSKLGAVLIIFFRAFTAYVRFKPDLVYMTLSPHGLAFYKDGFLALVLKALGAKMVFHMHGKGVARAAATSVLKTSAGQPSPRSTSIWQRGSSVLSPICRMPVTAPLPGFWVRTRTPSSVCSGSRAGQCASVEAEPDHGWWCCLR